MVEAGAQGVQEHPKIYDLPKIWAKSQKRWVKIFPHFLTRLKLYFFVIESTNKSLISHRKHINYIMDMKSTKGVRKGVGVNPSLSLTFYKNFITFAKEVNCFRILFAC